MSARAEWNDTTIGQSTDTVVVERNQYFPRGDVEMAFLKESDTTSTCPWKGTARYYHVEVDGQTCEDAAWYYPEPKDAAENIRDRIAFWNGVEVHEG